jgi:opacity protein-like surface antigen
MTASQEVQASQTDYYLDVVTTTPNGLKKKTQFGLSAGVDYDLWKRKKVRIEFRWSSGKYSFSRNGATYGTNTFQGFAINGGFVF